MKGNTGCVRFKGADRAHILESGEASYRFLRMLAKREKVHE
ncbi:hypothetical protein [Azospirillum largimobile]